jgi:uncharacterized surface protein with fasciclin (FAS1) repeats
MMKKRFLRLAVALSVATVVAGQIPTGAGIAFADGYEPPISGGSSSEVLVIGGAALAAYGIISTTAGGSGGGGPLISGGSLGRPIGDLGGFSNGQFSALQNLIDKAGLREALRTGGPYTILAPTNEAIGELAADVVADLLNPVNKEQLANLLQRHVLKGRYTINDLRKLPDGTPLETIDGRTVVVSNKDGLKIDGVPVTGQDISATNGWLHPLQGVLKP